jgi:hypothetical protein
MTTQDHEGRCEIAGSPEEEGVTDGTRDSGYIHHERPFASLSLAITGRGGCRETLLSARARLLFPHHKFHTHIAFTERVWRFIHPAVPHIAWIPSVFCGWVVLHGCARKRIGMPGTLLWEFISCITGGVPSLGQTVTLSSSSFSLF